MRSEEFALKLKNLPDSPGCYLMKSHGQIIYVGKAVNLKNRVRQYFQSSKNHTPKVQAMVERVDDFDIVLVDSEMEALALELNLIKRYRPKYNILLKDDKHFPYIRVDLAQDYPRLELVRRQARDGARYFGPYKGATAVREVLDVARMVFPIRTCNRVIRPEKPQRPCVHHEIGQCLAPCAGLTTREEYHAVLERAMEFLSGKDGPVLAELKERMADAARAMNYERAAVYRDRIRAVEDVMQRQKAISTHASDQDVIAVVPEESDAIIQMLFIRSGRLIGSEHYVLEGGGSEAPGEVILQFILQYYDAENMPPQELLLSAEPPERDVLEQLLSELHGRRTYILTPLRGEKRKLVAMAQKNARDEAEKRRKKLSRSRERTVGAAQELQRALGLAAYPRRIEGYDISNTQGALSVASIGGDDRRRLRAQGVPPLPHQDRGRRQRTLPPCTRVNHPPPLPRPARAGGQVRRNAGSHPHRRRAAASSPAAQDAMHALGLDIPMFGLAKRIEEIVLPDREGKPAARPRQPGAAHESSACATRPTASPSPTTAQLRGRHSVASALETIPGVGDKRRRRAADALQKRRGPAQGQSGGNLRRTRHEPPGGGEWCGTFCIPAIDSRPGIVIMKQRDTEEDAENGLRKARRAHRGAPR